MPLTFFGGLKPENKKYSRCSPLRAVTPPDLVYLPIDEQSVPLVNTDDSVKMGQVVALVDDEMPICSSVSGIVKGTAKEGERRYIAIENDKRDTVFEGIKGVEKPLAELSFEEICILLKQYAIVDCFDGIPLYKKLSSQTKELKRIIINCCEHDNYSAALYRLLLEQPQDLISGAKILMHALSIRKCVLVIEDKKIKAVSKLEECINDTRMFVTAYIQNKYPVNEQTILSAVYGKEIPFQQSASDLGYVFFGAEAVMQTYISFATGMPQISKAITVSGESIATPSNLIVPIGTPLKDLIKDCGGLVHRCRCVVNGGIMEGECMDNPGGVVSSLTTQLLLLRWIEKHTSSHARCIRCGRCINVCPMHLSPLDYAVEAVRRKKSRIPYYGIEACIECGCCEFICPSGVPLLDIIREEKKKRVTTQTSNSEIKKSKQNTDAKIPIPQETATQEKESVNENDFFIPF